MMPTQKLFADTVASNARPSDVAPLVTLTAARDRYFVPTVLGPFADEMARRLSRISTGPLLELCADTGVLTRANASALSAGIIIIASDPRADSIAHASAKSGVARVTWQQADPAALPFPAAAFGVVMCHFAVVGLPDRRRAFCEVRRVMRPSARFVFSVPAALRHNPVAQCVHDAVHARLPSDPPMFLADTFHGYANTDTIDDDLTDAGFTDAIYTSLELPYVAASAREAALGYCLGTTLRNEIEARAPGEIEPVIEVAASALRRRFGSGPIETTMRAQIISAAG